MVRRVAAGLALAVIAASCGGDDGGGATDGSPSDTGTAAPDGTDADGDGAGTTAAPEAGSEDDGDIVLGGSLRFAVDSEAACYVPSACSVSYGPGSVRSAVLDFLVRPAPTSEGYELELAESIEANDDFTEFTVTIPDGILYSDGTPLTAGDIETLFDEYVFGEGSSLRGNVSVIESTEALDDRTVLFTLSSSQAPFPALLTTIPIWKPEPGLTQTSIPIGSGPFVFESWEPNVETVLVRNPHSWRTDDAGNQLPYLDRVVVTPIASEDTRVNTLQAGDIDLAISTDPLVANTLETVATVHRLPLNAGAGLFYNNSTPPTDDIRVRRGLAHATNKDDLMEVVGGLSPRTQYWLDTSPWHTPEADEISPSYDVEMAEQLLQDYIDDPERSDGLEPGTPLTLDLAYIQGALAQESLAILTQQQWADVGVTVTITAKDVATLLGDAMAGNFNINYFEWATPHPFSLLTRNYGPWPETPTNYTHYNSEEIFEIVADMAVAATTEEMDELVQRSNLVFAEDPPLIFLYSTSISWATNDTVGNIDLLPGNGTIEWATLSTAG